MRPRYQGGRSVHAGTKRSEHDPCCWLRSSMPALLKFLSVRELVRRFLGVERDLVGDPRAGPEGRMARHELRQMVSGLRAVAEARQGHVRAELAALDLDAAVARHGRDLLVQPVQPVALLDARDQGARLLAARELFDAGDGDGEWRAGD